MTNPLTNDGRPAGSVLPRLSVLMFLQFFIWGAWYLSVSLYMYEHGMGDVRFYAFTAGPLAAIFAPFFTGMIADRFFNTEKILATLFLLAGGFMLLLPVIGNMSGIAMAHEMKDGVEIVTSEEVTLFGRTFIKGELFNWTILAHMLCYMPTLGLTASLSFHHLPKGSEQFPLMRLWGTIGWIVAGFVLAYGFKITLADGTEIAGAVRDAQFYLGGGAAVAVGLFCFRLPRTPPPKRGRGINFRDLFFLDAWAQMLRPSFAVFIIGSFLVCIPLAAYYASLQQQMEAMGFAPYIPAWKNTGTFIEAGMMFAMPFFFRKLGIKKMILIGIGAWILRYILFAVGSSPTLGGQVLVVAGIALHGICYDFFFVTGQVYVDRATPSSIRGQAQGMNIFFTQGLGLFLGAMVTQELADRAFGKKIASNSVASLEFWPQVWLPLAAMAAGILIVFALAFREEKPAPNDGETAASEA